MGQAKDLGIWDADWNGVANFMNNEFGDTDKPYSEAAWRKPYQQAKKFYEAGVFNQLSEDEYFKELEIIKRELQKERCKLQTEKLEYNRWLREEARDELFEEKVIEAIRKNIKVITPKDIPIKHGKRGGQLNFSDSHFGKDFVIYGLMNEIINSYNPEIFYQRMEVLYNQTLEIVKQEGFTELHINNLGDHIEGFIRNSQLWSLRFGAIDSAIIFGNYIGNWLNKLSHHVNVIYHQTDGNHDEFRLLDGKKNEHLCESAGKIVKNIIELKNEGNTNFKYIDNKTGFIFDNILGYNYLGIHGEVPNLVNAIKDFSDIYDIKIDYLIGGHKHHSDFVNCGVRRGTIGVGSIVGSDDFSMRIRKAADATASFIIYEEGKGKVCEHTIVLN